MENFTDLKKKVHYIYVKITDAQECIWIFVTKLQSNIVRVTYTSLKFLQNIELQNWRVCFRKPTPFLWIFDDLSTSTSILSPRSNTLSIFSIIMFRTWWMVRESQKHKRWLPRNLPLSSYSLANDTHAQTTVHIRVACMCTYLESSWRIRGQTTIGSSQESKQIQGVHTFVSKHTQNQRKLLTWLMSAFIRFIESAFGLLE